MKLRVSGLFYSHIRNNINTYFALLVFFVIGVSAGSFTVNGLSQAQQDELANYFQGFLQLLEYQKLDSSELLKTALAENMKLVLIMWLLGVTIIGIPFIFILIVIKGFLSGFSTGFIIKTLGAKGVLFSLLAVLPVELINVPCFIALGVSGINFSLKIIRSRSGRHFSRQDLKSNLLVYCFITLLFSGFLFAGALIESYITPVFMRMMAPVILG